MIELKVTFVCDNCGGVSVYKAFKDTVTLSGGEIFPDGWIHRASSPRRIFCSAQCEAELYNRDDGG